MSRKLLAILTALLIAASLCACNNEQETESETIDMNKETSTGDTTTEENVTDEFGSELGTSAPTEVGDPGEYDYTTCDETVYVNNPGSEVTLRTAEYEAKGSVAHGTELKRIGLSTDGANYWSKVVHEGNEYFVATKFLTVMANPDEGFADVTKTVVVNEKTGSLKIRNIPSMESQIIGYAIAGKDVKVVAENTTTGWYKVEFVNADGETTFGYIASNAEYFVAPETEAATEVVTEAATEAATEANTEANTEAASETSTEAATEAATGK